ncbi:glycosyltransferase [Nocardiopsis composta]|uniref:Vancomycin aglycone glucosyltransferase n=1 Tax=Nocardiopsis composta TaxID=157465 RepID=A0A7W8QRP1_9ACTN|nr:glycosyltransferase [Nocardiopsis composta]MBB5434628.1 vancomycin aglycone glucosyltransferase [Nocardiopsis composta]
MRVLLSAYGTRGDVEPVAALAVRLRALGAQVRVCAPPDQVFAELLARVGVPLVPFEKPWRSSEAGPPAAEERVGDVDAFVGGCIDATYGTLVEAAEECDVLLATGMLHFVARSAAEKAGVPHRFAVFAPVLDAPQRDAVVGAPINAHRASIGLPPVDDVRAFLFTERPWVAMDPVLAPRPDPAGLDTVRTGPWTLPDDRPLPADLAAFLDAGAPPVYVGFGSMQVLQDSARAAIEAARAQGRRVILSRGWAGLDPVDDAGDCFAVGEVNQQELFRRVAAVVHHGGAGTTATAARAGAPQVVVAQAADQPYWAARVADLGIGAAHDGPAPNAASLSAALRTALAPETRVRAKTVAGMVRTDGAETAARLLLDAAARGR